jgi:hypothetical protein
MAERMELKPGLRMLVLNMPDEYPALVGSLPEGIVLDGSPTTSPLGYDVVHLFATLRHELDAVLPTVRYVLAEEGAIWVSWPQEGSGMATDVDEAAIREVAQARGLRAGTPVAVDAHWYGMQLLREVA